MDKPVVGGSRPRWRQLFEVVTTVAMLVLAAVLVWESRARVAPLQPQPPAVVPVPKSPLMIGTAPVRGNKSASVAMIEFADFECPACASFASNVKPTLLRDYIDTGKVLFVFKNFPLTIHRQAKGFAAAAWCAGQQERFWQAHDWLYEQKQIQGLANAIGLDVPRYSACITGSGSDQYIESDSREAAELQLTGTPTFFFGTLTPDGLVQVTDSVMGAVPLQRFTETLDRLID